MNYCIDCDIAYTERSCPLCDAKAEIKTLEKTIENLNQLNERLRDEKQT